MHCTAPAASSAAPATAVVSGAYSGVSVSLTKLSMSSAGGGTRDNRLARRSAAGAGVVSSAATGAGAATGSGAATGAGATATGGGSGLVSFSSLIDATSAAAWLESRSASAAAASAPEIWSR